MKRIFSEKYKGAMLAAAIGDALGWPNEQNSNNLNKHYNELNAFVEWSRKCGGYWPYEERICAGEYSDDTQLLIATLRSLLRISGGLILDKLNCQHGWSIKEEVEVLQNVRQKYGRKVFHHGMRGMMRN